MSKENYKTLYEMSVEHPYYSCDCNYYANEASADFDTMTDFLDEFEECDVDLNLVFRWDVHDHVNDDGDPTGEYWAQVFIVKQRKGIYTPVEIKSVTEEENRRFQDFLSRHWERLQEMWVPVGKTEKGIKRSERKRVKEFAERNVRADWSSDYNRAMLDVLAFLKGQMK